MNIILNDFYIKQTPGEGNCLFYALSYLIFKNFNYHVTIRQKICDYLENNIIKDDDADIIDERKEIQDMRNDGVYGTEKEINAFSMSQIPPFVSLINFFPSFKLYSLIVILFSSLFNLFIVGGLKKYKSKTIILFLNSLKDL